MDYLLLFYSLLLLTIVDQTDSIRPATGAGLYLSSDPDSFLPDYSMIDTDALGPNTTLVCISSMNDTSTIGLWYYPTGDLVPMAAIDNTGPFSSVRGTGSVSLRRNDELLEPIEGLYKCIISDETGVNVTLVIGLYNTSSYALNGGPVTDANMTLGLFSQSHMNPPTFSLSFNVSNGPPTLITCYINGSPVHHHSLERMIVNGSGSVTGVSVVVTSNETGTYTCTVSNDRVFDGTINGVTATNSTTTLAITRSDAPVSFNASRRNTGLNHVRLSWSAVPGATEYEVYLSIMKFSLYRSLANSTETQVDITSGLFEKHNNTFDVIAYGSTSLPSIPVNTTITLTVPTIHDFTVIDRSTSNMTLEWSPPNVIAPNSYNINYRCHRECDLSDLKSEEFTNVLSPHQVTGVDPYSTCGFDLIGVYGNEIIYLVTNRQGMTLSATPTAPVGSITFTSVTSESMNVSWGPVPCNGRNGLIAGYYLSYTGSTLNITGSDTRHTVLDGLMPYTNYTVSVTPYGVNGEEGPPLDGAQLTGEGVPGPVQGISVTTTGVTDMSLTWARPLTTNGVITVYEIGYNHNLINTTDTYISINGLAPDTSYTVRIRAYTSAGSGNWSTIVQSTSDIPTVNGLSVLQLNNTSVNVTLRITPFLTTAVIRYKVYYSSSAGNGTGTSVVFNDTNGVITGLGTNMNYTMRAWIIIIINNGTNYEGMRSEPTTILIEDLNTQSTTSMISPSITLMQSRSESKSESISRSMIVTESNTISSNVNTDSGLIIGISVLSGLVIGLLIVILIILILIMMKRRKRIKRSLDIGRGTASPAGITTSTVILNMHCGVIENPTYSKVEESMANGGSPPPAASAPVVYDVPKLSDTDGHYDTPTLPARIKETPYEDIDGERIDITPSDYEVPSLTLNGHHLADDGGTSIVIDNPQTYEQRKPISDRAVK
uniref:Uncharacterized protein n=1 Tax=Amphimedon queenslandica TaxID=400682 RepID=A0A1X7TTJ7_AMPQE